MFSLLGWQAWLTLGIVVVLVIALIREFTRPDLVFLGGLAALLLFGILTPGEAFAGFSNSALIAVGSLLVVAAGVHNTGALRFADRFLFGRTIGRQAMMIRMMGTTATLSAFLNNTPIVAMLIPRVKAWAERRDIPASKLMIPLSYAAIFGGMTTLIGTSTNLLVSGLMQAEGYEGLGFFDLALVGGPAALVGIIYFSLIGHRFLPDRSKEQPALEKGFKSCLFELRVAPDSTAGKTVEDAGLRALGTAYLAHVQRGQQLIPSAPDLVLESGDRLIFQGSPAALTDLLRRPGLERVVKVDADNYETLPLFEAVVAHSSELVGSTLRDVNFRERYQGVVLGIQRRNEQVDASLGRTKIEAGDLLLIEAPDGFDRRWNENREEFYLVAPRRSNQLRPSRHSRQREKKAPIALAIIIAVIAFAALGIAPVATTAFVGALATMATGCLSIHEARHAVDVPVLLIIGSALGLGVAIDKTGLADVVADSLMTGVAPIGVVGVLAVVYLATNLLTEVITNNGAAALMLPVSLSVAVDMGVPPKAFAITVAIAASASFISPIGYQTNLMVMAPGGYRFSDYLRSGAPLTIAVACIAVTMVWLVWL